MFRLILLTLWLAVIGCGQPLTLLVLHKGSSELGFYTAGNMEAKVAVGRHPHEILVSPDRRYAYITDNGAMRIEHPGQGGNTISIVDLASRKKVGEISLGESRRPHGLDLDPRTGHLVVTAEFPDQLLLVDAAARRVVRRYDTKGKTSHMVRLGPRADWAYVSNSNSANVSAIRLATGEVRLIAVGERPQGAVLSRDGRLLFVTCREARKLAIIDTARQEAVGEIRTGKGPSRVALTPDGRQLVYNLVHENKVEFADTATRAVLGQVALAGKPMSLNLSPDGKLAFAAAEESDTVYVIAVPERKVVQTFRTPAGAAPDPVLQLGGSMP